LVVGVEGLLHAGKVCGTRQIDDARHRAEGHDAVTLSKQHGFAWYKLAVVEVGTHASEIGASVLAGTNLSCVRILMGRIPIMPIVVQLWPVA
jgi:hypothetical protein